MENSLNRQILEWWYQLPDKLRGNEPTFIHPLNQNAEILFVGLNPSGTTKDKPPINHIPAHKIKEIINKEQKYIFESENQYKPYYGPLSTIAIELHVQFEHCDLFHMSYRTAKVVKEELYEKNGDLKPIHQKHLSVFTEILNYINPKVVITNNVITARILEKHLSLTFDAESLMHVGENGTYFYLNGIMSYGRLTRYDKKRLTEIVKRVLIRDARKL